MKNTIPAKRKIQRRHRLLFKPCDDFFRYCIPVPFLDELSIVAVLSGQGGHFTITRHPSLILGLGRDIFYHNDVAKIPRAKRFSIGLKMPAFLSAELAALLVVELDLPLAEASSETATNALAV